MKNKIVLVIDQDIRELRELILLAFNDGQWLSCKMEGLEFPDGKQVSVYYIIILIGYVKKGLKVKLFAQMISLLKFESV